MVHRVVSVAPSASLAEAAKRMRGANVGILPVVEDTEVRGVITDRDVVVRAIAEDADLANVLVGDCASSDPIVAHPEWDVDQAMETMARAQVGRLPVVENGNRLVGHRDARLAGVARAEGQRDAPGREGSLASLRTCDGHALGFVV